jgi:hypothetical protein
MHSRDFSVFSVYVYNTTELISVLHWRFDWKMHVVFACAYIIYTVSVVHFKYCEAFFTNFVHVDFYRHIMDSVISVTV